MKATFTFTVSKLAGYIVDSICKKYITEYDFTVLDDAEPQISSWYGIKNINTGFERVDIIEKMILQVMEQEVCDKDTKLLVQLSY